MHYTSSESSLDIQFKYVRMSFQKTFGLVRLLLRSSIYFQKVNVHLKLSLSECFYVGKILNLKTVSSIFDFWLYCKVI